MTTSAGLTAALADFVVGMAERPVPDAAAAVVRTGFIDTIATMLAGRDEPVVGVVRGFVAAQAGPAGPEHRARVLLGAETARARDAALINGTAGHALDYDDVALAGHPSTVLVPAVIAVAEQCGASGLDALRAYVAGYEVWAELIGRDPDAHHLKGWHPTGVFGTVAAAAATALLLRYDRALTQRTLAIAASMSAGLVANFGTMTKPFHAGQAAAHGIDAAMLARAGLTAAPDALEHHAGFLAALSPHNRVDRASPLPPLGERLRITESGLSIKKYPVCYATHRVIDAVLDLAQAHDLAPQDIERVDATIGVAQASMLRNARPQTALEAKFSLQFAVASALTARAVGLAQLDDGFVRQPQVQALFDRLRIDTVDTEGPLGPAFARSDRVGITLRDGRRLDSGEVAFARGDAHRPLAPEQLRDKFLDCARSVRFPQPERLFEQLSALQSLPRVSALAAHG